MCKLTDTNVTLKNLIVPIFEDGIIKDVKCDFHIKRSRFYLADEYDNKDTLSIHGELKTEKKEISECEIFRRSLKYKLIDKLGLKEFRIFDVDQVDLNL
jgi:hypothetical protein